MHKNLSVCVWAESSWCLIDTLGAHESADLSLADQGTTAVTASHSNPQQRITLLCLMVNFSSQAFRADPLIDPLFSGER